MDAISQQVHELVEKGAADYELEAIKLRAAASGPKMSLEQARELTAVCVRVAMSMLGAIEEELRLPEGVSLEKLLEANRIVDENPTVDNADGSKTIYMRVEPRLLAGIYALQNYENDPLCLLQGLGFRPRPKNEDDDE
jgi:hypothetical protein